MSAFHKDVWAFVLSDLRERQPSGEVELLIGELEAELGRGEFNPNLPETRAVIETILDAVMPGHASLPAGE